MQLCSATMHLLLRKYALFMHTYIYDYAHQLLLCQCAFVSFKHIFNEFDVKNLSIGLLYCL